MGEGFWVRKHSKVSARHKKGSSDEALRAPKEQSTRGNVKYQTVQRWYSAAKDRDETQTGTGRAKSSLKYKIRIHNRSVRPKKQSNVGGSPTGHWDGFIIVRHLPDWVYKSSGNRMNQESRIINRCTSIGWSRSRTQSFVYSYRYVSEKTPLPGMNYFVLVPS